jgi:hypothetical protein
MTVYTVNTKPNKGKLERLGKQKLKTPRKDLRENQKDNIKHAKTTEN